MDSSTQRYIDSLAETVIDAYNVKIPICSIENVVRNMGGTVEEKAGLDDLYDGTIRKTGPNSFTIAISPFQSDRRKAFTIAHE